MSETTGRKMGTSWWMQRPLVIRVLIVSFISFLPLMAGITWGRVNDCEAGNLYVGCGISTVFGFFGGFFLTVPLLIVSVGFVLIQSARSGVEE
jgi:hypothetical protein